MCLEGKSPIALQNTRDAWTIEKNGFSSNFCFAFCFNFYLFYSRYKLQDESDTFRDPVPPDDKRNVSKNEHDKPLEGCNVLPVHIYKLPKRARFVAAGGSTNAAILEDHTLYTWGLGADGQMARSKNMTNEMTELTASADGAKIRVPKIDKSFYMIEPREDGDRPTPNFSVLEEHYFTPKPVIFQGMSRMEVYHVSVGNDHMLVTAKAPAENNYHAWSAGVNGYGKLGHGDQKPVHELKKVRHSVFG